MLEQKPPSVHENTTSHPMAIMMITVTQHDYSLTQKFLRRHVTNLPPAVRPAAPEALSEDPLEVAYCRSTGSPVLLLVPPPLPRLKADPSCRPPVNPW
jgi:hypothetical protein